MKMQGKIDSLRRVKIPTHLLKELNFSKRQAVEVSIQYGKICIRKFENQNLQTKPFVGIVRNLDHEGRVVIPSEYLKLLKFNLGDVVNLELEN